jgi:putative ABC transport system permease protein
MDLTPDLRALVFALIISGFVAIVLGSIPSLHISEAMVMSLLKGSTLWIRGGKRERAEVGSLAVASQIAVSMVVLILAARFLRTVRILKAAQPGFNTNKLVLLSLKPIQDGSVRYTTESLARFMSKLIPEIQAMPGVVGTATAGVGPFSGHRQRMFPITTDHNKTVALEYSGDLVSPGFFKMMGIPLAEGRDFTASDNDHAPGVLVITEAMAHRLFGNEDPVGRRISVCPLSVPGCQNQEIVGVVPDLRYNQPSDSSGLVWASPFSTALSSGISQRVHPACSYKPRRCDECS